MREKNFGKAVIILGLLFSIILITHGKVSAQSDSLLYREMDLKRIGVNFFNFSKPDKFNFEVIVLGGVKNSGIYLLAEGTSLIELVALTGGTGDESFYDYIKLIRAKTKNPEIKADTVMVVSYKDFFDKEKIGSMSKHNPLLRPGDIISFPIKPDKDFWEVASKVATIIVIPLFTLSTLILQIMIYNK